MGKGKRVAVDLIWSPPHLAGWVPSLLGFVRAYHSYQVSVFTQHLSDAFIARRPPDNDANSDKSDEMMMFVLFGGEKV